MDTIREMEIKNIKKRFRGKTPVIEVQADGTKVIKLKMRKNKRWIHR